MPGVTEQPFRLTQADPVIVETTTGGAAVWADMWKYQVPMGTSLIIKPHHTFSAYIADVGAEVGDTDCSVKIEKRDASESSVLVIFGPLLYARLGATTFVDEDLKPRFRVPEEGVIISEREYLVIACYDNTGVTGANCYWEAHIARVRKTIGA